MDLEHFSLENDHHTQVGEFCYLTASYFLQKLARLLYQAADEGLVDGDKVEKILGLSRDEAESQAPPGPAGQGRSSREKSEMLLSQSSCSVSGILA